MLVHHDEATTVIMAPPPRVSISFTASLGVNQPNRGVTLMARRQDMGETGTEREIKPPQTSLTPGHWEIGATTPPGEYVESIPGSFGGMRRQVRPERPADRFDLFIESRFQQS